MTNPPAKGAESAFPDPKAIEALSVEELRRLIFCYGSIISAVCVANNLDTFFIPDHVQIPDGHLALSRTPLGLGITFIRRDQTRSNPNAKLN